MVIASFGGIIPRLAEHKLLLHQATVAHDCRLRDGILEAWREPCKLAGAVANAVSFYLYGCCVLSWNEIINVTELTPDWGRFYCTNRNCNGLEYGIVDSCCNVEYVPCGVPTPLSAPRAAAGNECSRESDARAYVYTYVNEWGEESAPSPASNIVRVDDGTIVTVSGIAPPPEGYHIVYVNIYRSATGFRPADGKVQQQITDFLLVATLAAGATSFTDGIKTVKLGPVLETQYDRMPPMMTGVVAIGDQVRLAGFNKNQIYLSEPHQPHNWPAKYDLTLDYHIVHMLAQDQRLFVTTQSIPYIIDVSSCDETACTPVTSLETPLPDIGCHYPHGAIMTAHGMFYASPIGIILLQGNGSWHIITARWFGEKEWLKLRPDTIRMAYYQGFLMFATDMGTFLMDIDGRPYADFDSGELVTLSDRPIDMLTSNTGKLLFLQDGAIWTWDSGTTLRPYVWRSRYITSKPLSEQSTTSSSEPVRDNVWWPVSAKLDGAARLIIEDSRGHFIFDRLLTDSAAHRVRRHGRHLQYHIQIQGTEPVNSVSLGTSIFTVNVGQ